MTPVDGCCIQKQGWIHSAICRGLADPHNITYRRCVIGEKLVLRPSTMMACGREGEGGIESFYLYAPVQLNSFRHAPRLPSDSQLQTND